jgi:aryl-alcohol dehydrogenase-like predicted oxidoreductase
VSSPSVPLVPLGHSGIEVSRLALGSWRTYERISRDQGVSVMRAAREAGINFLDDARYNDETGRAPIPTGYSEVPPEGVPLEDAVGMIAGLIAAGTARAWGTLNWTPEQMEQAARIAAREGVPGPTATQPPFSLVRREIVQDPAMPGERDRLAAVGQPR